MIINFKSSKKSELSVIIPTKQSLCILQGLFYYINLIDEWLEGRLAIADNSDEMIIRIRERIEDVIDKIDYLPDTSANEGLLNSIEPSLKVILHSIIAYTSVILIEFNVNCQYKN